MDYERVEEIRRTLYDLLTYAKKKEINYTYIYLPDLEGALNALTDLRSWLDNIERIAREAFSDPETQDINLYRAQALAKIFQIFEYDGATLKKDEEV